MKSFWILLFLGLPLGAADRPDPWQRMAGRDRNGDGRISREEFPGPEAMFERLDANRDGMLTEAEMRRQRELPRGPLRPGGGPAGGMALWQRADANQDEQVSLQEWNDFFTLADENADKILQPEEWQAASRGVPLKDPAPALGDRAPAVKARRLGSSEEVDLSAMRRPTVLIFGSYT